MSCMSRSSRLDGRGWLPPSALWGFAVLQVLVRKNDSSSLWSNNRTYKSTDSPSSLPLSSHRREWPVIPYPSFVSCNGRTGSKVAYGEKKNSEYPHWILLRPEHGESPETVYTAQTVSKSNRYLLVLVLLVN